MRYYSLQTMLFKMFNPFVSENYVLKSKLLDLNCHNVFEKKKKKNFKGCVLKIYRKFPG